MGYFSISSLLAVAACLAVPAHLSAGISVVIPSSRDNTLFESPTGDLSNGSGPFMFAGETGTGTLRRALVRFDMGALVPAGAIITNVQIKMHVSQTSSATESVSLQRLLADWGEGASNSGSGGGPGQGGGAGAPSEPGDATWIHTFYPGSLWTTPGGDFEPTPSAISGVAGVGFFSWEDPQLVADVQGWLNAPATNFGWLLLGDEEVAGTAKRFDSRESPTEAFRPTLTVTYIPAPSSAAALGIAVLCAGRRRRGRMENRAGNPSV